MSKKNQVLIGFTILILIILSLPAGAQEKPVQVSLFTPIQIFPEDTQIAGIRINFLYGRNVSVTGLDIGLVNHTTAGLSKGVQWGAVGMVEANFLGWQGHFANITKGDFEGFQSGFVNYANNANGFQLGVVNYARTLKGLQIGLINFIKQGGQFPVFPIVNWSF